MQEDVEASKAGGRASCFITPSGAGQTEEMSYHSSLHSQDPGGKGWVATTWVTSQTVTAPPSIKSLRLLPPDASHHPQPPNSRARSFPRIRKSVALSTELTAQDKACLHGRHSVNVYTDSV